MKKLLFFIVLLSFTTVGYSQLKGGIKGGLNLSQLDADGADASNRTGFHGGLYFEASLAGFGIMPEVLFSSQGSEFDGGGEFNLSYVQVPVLFKKSFAKVLNFHIGPQFGILLNAENEDGTDIKDSLKGSDLSLALGVGADLPAGISGGLRYVYGLSDIADDAGFGTEINSRTIQIYIGYKLFGN